MMRMEQYIVREAELMALTDHRNIVKLIKLEPVPYHKYVLVVELCNGCLHDLIKPNGLEYSDFVELCQALSSAIQHLRQHNMVHRDIKPENILVANQGDQKIYKLGDFGTAGIVTDNDSYTTLHGTPQFMHPDMFAKWHAYGLDNIDPSITLVATNELWSIGVTLYQSATGHLPFHPKDGCEENCRLMYAMITGKNATPIAAVETEDGEIKWLNELPVNALTSMVNNTFKKRIEAYLAGLLTVRKLYLVSQDLRYLFNSTLFHSGK